MISNMRSLFLSLSGSRQKVCNGVCVVKVYPELFKQGRFFTIRKNSVLTA